MFRLTPRVIQRAHRYSDWLLALASSGKPSCIQVSSSNRSSMFTSSSRMDGNVPAVGTLDDMMTRSKNSSDIQKIVFALPDVARIPTKRRTFHLDHGDLETLVRPLLLCHWHVGHVGDALNDLQVFSLNKLFSFKDFRSAVEFFDALADTQDEENHHARVTVDCAHVYVSTHTHVAHQRIDSDAHPVKVPGLTARDIRFAAQVERLHKRFLGDERAVTKVPSDAASLQAWSMEQLQRRYPKTHE